MQKSRIIAARKRWSLRLLMMAVVLVSMARPATAWADDTEDEGSPTQQLSQTAPETGMPTIHKVVLAYPEIELVREQGEQLVGAPRDWQINAWVELIRSLVRNMPSGSRAIAPLPHELGDDYELALCHREAFFTLAEMMGDSLTYREILQRKDALKYVLDDDEKVCAHPNYADADAVFYIRLSGLEQSWATHTKDFVGALFTIASLAAGAPTRIPGKSPENLTLRVAMVDPATHKVLAWSKTSNSGSAEQEVIEALVEQAALCLDKSAAEQNSDEVPDQPGRLNMPESYEREPSVSVKTSCLSFAPYKFTYIPPEEREAPPEIPPPASATKDES
ncbi:MAG: hypothetical protein KDH09_09540 [Chrysiogenetes bacterium]|nr:hypothetical protein [Chrysiogenetes bacterium]